MNVGLSAELSLAKLMIFWLANALSTGSILFNKSMAGPGKMECLTSICILRMTPLPSPALPNHHSASKNVGNPAPNIIKSVSPKK